MRSPSPASSSMPCAPTGPPRPGVASPAGEDWTDLDLIVERGDGQPVDPGTYGHAFVRIARKAGLAGVRLHDLRHAYATALLEGGVHPGVASAVLGHASPAFTMSAYQHVMDHQADRAAAALETVLDAAR
ncbi:MAG: tyrosine-type recombinase/integrase [Acidimicrobiia bacterium]|nr:tyrosine-type recombinase/integrase [Acidimicrobiia bacterium]